jgi:hypothetical protein
LSKNNNYKYNFSTICFKFVPFRALPSFIQTHMTSSVRNETGEEKTDSGEAVAQHSRKRLLTKIGKMVAAWPVGGLSWTHASCPL